MARKSLDESRPQPSSVSLSTLRGSHTPLYASPEQIRGEPADPRDDVHALGVIWYQLLVGDLDVGVPAGSGWKAELRQRGVPQDMIDLVEKCFDAHASHRVENASVLADHLQNILLPVPPPAQPKQEADSVGTKKDSPAAETTPEEMPPARQSLEKGKALLGQNQPARAVRAFKEALRLDPDLLEAYRQRVRAYVALGKFEEAQADLKKVISRDASPADHMCAAQLQEKKGNLDGAVADLDKALRLDGKYLPALLARGQVHAARGRHDLAGNDFRAALALAPGSADVYLARGEVHLKLKQYDAALADFEEGLRQRPDDVRLHLGRGRILLARGDHQGALAELTRVIDHDPNCADAFLERGLISVQCRDDSQAIRDFEEAIRLKPLRDAYLGKARAQVRLGQWGRAQASYQRALKVGPVEASLWLECGDVYLEKGDVEEAVAAYQKAIKLDRNSAEAFGRRGRANRLRGHWGKALTDLNRALELDNSRSDLLLERARAQNGKKQYQQAVEDANSALEAQHDCIACLAVRGVAYAGLKLFDQAIADLDEVVRLSGGQATAEVHDVRGLIRLEREDHDGALDDFTKAIRFDGKSAGYYRHRALAYERKGKAKQAAADRARADKLAPRAQPPAPEEERPEG